MASIINATTTNGVAVQGDNSGSLQLQTNNGTTAVTIDTSQNVGVGTTTINDRLVVQSSSAEQGITIRGDGLDAIKIGMVNPSVSNDGVIGMKINNALRFITNNTERMRIDSSGRLLVGTTSWSGGSTNAGVAIKATSTSSSVFAFYIDDSGGNNIVNMRCDGSTYNKTGSWGTISDQRLKENIVDATPKLDKVTQLKVRNYNLIGDDLKQIGFVAQEIEKVFPSLVSETSDLDEEGNDLGTTTKTVKTTVLIPILVKAIQELKAELDATKAEVQALKGVK